MADEGRDDRGLAAELGELRTRARALDEVVAALRESQERFKAFTSESAYAYFEMDLEGNLVSANRRTEEISGYSQEELIGLNFRDLIVETDLARAAGDIQRALVEPNAGPREYSIKAKDGSVVDIESNALPLRRQGRIVGLQCTAIDVTGRRTAGDRSPYVVIDAILHTIAKLCPDIADADAAWEGFVERKGAEHREYLETIRRTRHTFFLYQQHELYEFGAERTKSESTGEFCAECGRVFVNTFFLENVMPFLQLALASRGNPQSAVVDMLRTCMHRHVGDRFAVSDDRSPEAVVLTFEHAAPDEAARYFMQYGLDPERCFRNSVRFVAGAFEEFLSEVVAGFDRPGLDLSFSGRRAVLRLPVREADSFTYGALIQTLMGYIQEIVERQQAVTEGESLGSDLVTGSEAMRRTWDRIRRASRTDEIVFLRGESGTGKSFIARKIHGLSPRRDRPFIEVCLASDIGSDNMIQSDLFGHEKGAFTGALEQKKGLFSLADGGTIFLDEVGDASAELQAKLLRVIEASTFKRLGGVHDLTVDVRVIAATNRDLEKMVDEGTFRRDLYYRLNVIPIELPPLRERPEDIPALAAFLLARTNRGRSRPVRLPEEVASRLCRYPWPGNIRELDHAIKHAAAMSEEAEIADRDFPPAVQTALSSDFGELGSAACGELATGSRAASGDEEGVASSRAARVFMDKPSPRVRIIDSDALREAVRSTDEDGVGEASFESPAHVDFAKRRYLAVLIDELGGDLGRIGRFWDRHSEKTLRKLIREYGLADRLDAARARSRESG